MGKTSVGANRSFFEFALALSATLLCICLTFNTGFLNHGGRAITGISLLTITLLLNFAALCFPNAKIPDFSAVPFIRIIFKAPGLVLFLGLLGFQGWLLSKRYSFLSPLIYILPLAIGLAFYAFFGANKNWTAFKTMAAGLTLLLFVLCGASIFSILPRMVDDVSIFQRDSALALAAGQNPYELTFPNIYGDDTPYYGPGISVNGILQFGFPYTPLPLIWVTPAELLFGNFRYGHLMALAIGGALIVALRPSPFTLAAALVMLFSQPTFFLLRVGWMEPVSIVMVCLLVWAAGRSSRLNAVLTGLVAASKQYLVFVFPLATLLPKSREEREHRGMRVKDIVIAVATAALITLPLCLWNISAFVHSVVVLQFRQPFRDDALSYLAFVKSLGGPQPPFWIGFVAAALAVWFCLRRAPRTTAGFAASLAFVQCIFFAFAKQAFLNYYYFVFATLCCAAAAAHAENNASDESRSTLLTAEQ